MKHDFVAAMRRATRATRAFDLAKATSIIQDAIMPRTAPEEARPPRQSAAAFRSLERQFRGSRGLA